MNLNNRECQSISFEDNRLGKFEGGTVQFLPTVSTISFGLGVLQESLASAVHQTGANTVLLLTPYSIGFGHIVKMIMDVLEGLAVKKISVSAEHVPVDTLAKVLSQLEEEEPDVVIALGGSSTMDLAKGVRVFRSLGIKEANQIVEFMKSPRVLCKAPIPQISIPTTLSGSEYTRSFSAIDFNNREKLSFTETLCASQTIFYDPIATRETPHQLWMSSGIMALNHAIEVMVASPPNEISDCMKLTSAAYLFQHLPASAGDSELPEVNNAREFCQVAAWMADHSPMRVRTRNIQANILYSHSLAYQIAGRYKIPYGLIACTTLPSCLRSYTEENERFKNRIDQISEALPNYSKGFTNTNMLDEPKGLIERVDDLIAQSGLPLRLRDVGIPRNGLGRLAEDFGTQNSNGFGEDARVLKRNASKILEDAW